MASPDPDEETRAFILLVERIAGVRNRALEELESCGLVGRWGAQLFPALTLRCSHCPRYQGSGNYDLGAFLSDPLRTMIYTEIIAASSLVTSGCTHLADFAREPLAHTHFRTRLALAPLKSFWEVRDPREEAG